MPNLTRGSLPARVYWVRRLMVLATAVLLVFAVGRLLGDGSDGSDGDAARLTAEQPSPTPSVTTDTAPPTPTATESRRGKPGKGRRTSEAPVLAAPTGPCVGSDVVVEPTVGTAVAGRDVTIVLQLRTQEADACTWRVSPDTLTVNLTSGKDRIWTSRDCPRAIPRTDVVVRSAVATKVDLVWAQAKRSGDRCTTGTGWAYPGWYHVTAAALGGEPFDLQFELETPTAATITKTVTPKQSPSDKPKNKPKNKPSGTPSNSPSGAVEPNSTR